MRRSLQLAVVGAALFLGACGGIQPWDYGSGNQFGDTTSLLRNAMVKNPYMKVMIAAGYFDLATPYYAVEYTFNHMGLSPEMHKQITWDFYQAGHMLYIDTDSHAKLSSAAQTAMQSLWAANVNTGQTALTDGQVVYIVEAYFQSPDLSVGALAGNGVYARYFM